MANTKIKATAELFLDTSNASKDAKKFIDDLKKKLDSIETAADKMTVFQDLVGYIAQIDKSLAALKAKNGDAFNHMFDGMDASFRAEFEKIFGIAKGKLTELNSLRTAINNATSQNTSPEQLKEWETKIKEIYALMGRNAALSGRGKFETRIKNMQSALDDFAHVWKNTMFYIEQGFTFGGSGTGSGGDGVDDLSNKIDTVKKKIQELENEISKVSNIKKELENAMKVVNDFNDTGDLSKNLQVEMSVESVRQLMTEYLQLSKVIKNQDTTSSDYYSNLIKQSKLAMQIVNMQDRLQTAGTDNNTQNVIAQLKAQKTKNGHSLYSNFTAIANKAFDDLNGTFEDRYNDFLKNIQQKQDELDKLYIDLNDMLAKQGHQPASRREQGTRGGDATTSQTSKNKELALSYDELSKKVQEYKTLKNQLDTQGSNLSQDDIAELQDRIEALDEYFDSLGKTQDEVSKIQNIMSALSFGDIDVSGAIKQLSTLLNITEQIADNAEATSGAMSGQSTTGRSGIPETVTANVDFTSLENTIRTEAASLSQKLDNILKVELVKDDTNIQEAINGIKSTIDKISASIDNYKLSKDASGKQAEIDTMKANLTQLLNFVSKVNEKKINGKYQQQEIGAAILSDGTISAGYGEHGTVPWDRMASSLVANLTKSLLVDVHSHPWAQFQYSQERYANDAFSGSHGDLGAFRFSKDLGAKLTSMITGNIMRIFDVSKLSRSQMIDFRAALSDIEKTYANTPAYSKYMGYNTQTNKLFYRQQDTPEGQHKVTEAFESLMYKAFERIGLSKDQVDKDIFKKYNLTDDAQLTALAERLVQLTHASNNALSPIERLSEIISHFGGNVNTDRAKSLFEEYNKGEKNAADVFNALTPSRYQINQDTIDSLLNIDSGSEIPAVESLLTQITGILSTISSSVSNISNNTRQNTSDRFDMAINDLMDFRDGVNRDIASEIESIFDPRNISEYKNQEVAQIADASVLDAVDYIQDLFTTSMRSGSVDADEAQIALDKFYMAISHVSDAMEQIDLYESRTGKEFLDKSGNWVRGDLGHTYAELINGDHIQSLLYLLSQAKIDIQKQKDVYKDGLGRTSSTEYVDTSSLVGYLQSIQYTLDSIYGTLRGFTGIEADNRNALKYKEPVVDNNKALNDFSEQDLSVLNSILQVLGDIESHIYMYTNKTPDTSEDAGKDINDDTDLDNFIRAKLSQQFATEETLQMVKAVVDSLYARVSQTEEQKKPEGQNPDQKQESDVYQLLANRLPTNIATDDTLLAIKGVLEQIVASTKNKGDDKNNDQFDVQKNLGQLVGILTAAVQNLQHVANGIVQHQKAQKTDTSAAIARITDPAQHQQISDIARNSVGTLGSDVEIKSLKALSNGLVKVEGAFKNVNGEWEGFTVKVNEANAAVDLAIDKQSAFAKALNKSKDQMDQDDDNEVRFSPEETYKKALEYMKKLNAEGKKATLQYQDSGRYTVSAEEMVGGLSKKTFQTFDEFQRQMSRTTVTLSNDIASSIRDANKLISDSSDKVGNADLLAKYNTEYANLIVMNQKYEAMDNLGQADIEAWNQQIALVQRLGSEVSSLIKQQEKLEGQAGVATSAKRLQEYQAKANQLFKDTKIDLNAEQQTLEQQKIISFYDQIISKVDTLRKSHAVLTDEQIKDINALISSLQKEADAYIDAHGLRKDTQKPKAVDPNKEIRKTRKELLDDTESKLRGTFNTLDFKIDTKALSAEQQKIADEYKELSEIIKKYGRDAAQVSQQDFDATLQRVSALQKEIDAYKEKYHIINGRGGTKNAYGKTMAVNAQAKFNTLQNRAKPYIDAGSTVVNDSLIQYEQSLKKLIALQSQFKSGQDLSPDQMAQFTQLKNECNAYGQALKKVLDESDRLMANGSKPLDLMDDMDVDTYEGRAKALKEYVQYTYQSSAAIGKLNADATQLLFTLKNGDGTITNMAASLNAARTVIASTAGETQQATTAFGKFFNEISAKARSISTYLLSMTGIEEIFQQIRNGVQYVRDIDSALTELKKVTNETGAAYDRFLQDMSKTAGIVGSTVKDLTTMAAEWSRLGYSMDEAGKLAESTAVLLNVSEFTDATTASEALISTMQAFQYTAEDSQHVVDILNEVGNNYAVSSDGIATALQDSASALMEGGNNLEQATALVAAANRVVQDPASVGSALRTISLRLRGTSVEILEEMGEETDGVVESTSKLQEKLKALTGVDILTDAGAYKDTYTILKEIGEVWQNIDPMDQAAALELIAGKNRANTLAAILNNMKDLNGAYEDAMKAEGSALKENAAYMDSIQGRIDLFNNAVQTMWMNFLDDDVLKFLINVGTGFINLVDTVGVLETAIAGVLTYLSASSNFSFDLASMLGIHKKDANFLKGFDIFGKEGLTGQISKLFDGVPKEINKHKTEVEVSVQDLANAIQDNLSNYVDLDTSSIDAEIETVQNKLLNARQELETAKKADFDYYKSLGSKAPAKDRNVRIDDKTQEIKNLEAQLSDLEVRKNRILDSAAAFTAESVIPTVQAETQAYQSMLTVLDQVKNVKLSMGDEQYAATQIDNISNAAKNGQTALANYVSTLGDSDVALKAYVASVNDGNYSLAGFQQFIQQHNAALQASSIAAKAAAVGHQLLNAALSMGVSLLASWAIGAVVKGLDSMITTAEEAAEQVEELTNAYNKAKQSFKDNLETLITPSDTSVYATLQDEFNKLAQGVDKYGNNISLTSDEYERYKEICDQIVGVNPKIAAGYDSSTKAIGNNVNMLSQLIELQKISARQNAEEYLKDENLDKIAEDTYNDFDDARDEYENVKRISEQRNNEVAQSLVDQFSLDEKYRETYGETPKEVITNMLDMMGYDQENIQSILDDYKDEQDNYNSLDFFSDFMPKIAQNEHAFSMDGVNLISDFLKEVDYEYKDISSYADTLKDSKDGLIDTLLQVPISSKDYEGLTDDGQRFIVDWIKNSEQFKIDDDASKGDIKELAQDSRDNIIAMIKELSDSSEQIDIQGKKLTGQDIIGQIYDFDASKQDWDGYKEQINAYIDGLWKLIGGEQNDFGIEKKQDLNVAFGVNFEEADDLIDQANEQVDGHLDLTMEQIQSHVDQMNAKQIKAYYSIDWNEADWSKINSWQDILDMVNKQVQAFGNTVTVQTYASLSDSIDSYNEVLAQTREIATNNTEVTQEYKDSLEALGFTEEELAECFDENNKLVVTNAKQLKKLVKEKKNEVASDVKLAKAQAQLEYYDLYRQMSDTIDSTSAINGETLDYINSLYDEMSALQGTIAKLSLLEAKLLGAANAYDRLEEAQNIDAANDYASKAEELVNVLGEAFRTSELGTEAAKVAIDGLIPDDVIDKTKTLDEQMEQIWKYFSEGTLSKLFTIEVDDKGAVSSVEMTQEKIKEFTESLFSTDFIDPKTGENLGKIFSGTWDEFELNPAITSLEQFAKACGITEEVAFAFLTKLEDYDINWLGGDNETLLDQLIGDDLEYKIQKTTQELAELTKEKAELLESGITDDEQQRLDEINSELEKLNGTMDEHRDKAYDTWQSYSDNENILASLDQIADKTATLTEDQAKELGLTWDKDKTVQEYYDELLAKQIALGQPTELIVQLAAENVQEEIDTLIEKLGKEKIAEIEAEIQFNPTTGKWEFKDGATNANNQDAQAYLELKTELGNLNTFLNTNAVDPTTYLSNIQDILQGIADKIGAETKNPTGGEGGEKPAPEWDPKKTPNNEAENERDGYTPQKEVKIEPANAEVILDNGYLTGSTTTTTSSPYGAMAQANGDTSTVTSKTGGAKDDNELKVDKIQAESVETTEPPQPASGYAAAAQGNVPIQQTPVSTYGAAAQGGVTQDTSNLQENPGSFFEQAGKVVNDILENTGDFLSGIFMPAVAEASELTHDERSVATQTELETPKPEVDTVELFKQAVKESFDGASVDDVITAKQEKENKLAELIKNYQDSKEKEVESATIQVETAEISSTDSFAAKGDTNGVNNQSSNIVQTDITIPDIDGIEDTVEQVNELNSASEEANVTIQDLWTTYSQSDPALTSLTTILSSLGATETQVGALVGRIQDVNAASTFSTNDPMGLGEMDIIITLLIASLKYLLSDFENVRQALSESVQIDIGADDLLTILQENNFTPEALQTYLQTLSASLQIAPEGEVTLKSDQAASEIENLKTKASEGVEVPATITVDDKSLSDLTLPEDKTMSVTTDLDTSDVDKFTPPDKSGEVNYTATFKDLEAPTLYGTVVYRQSGGGAKNNGKNSSPQTPKPTRADGTAHAQGSWGAPKTETALVGELGPELLVRDGHWTTIGNNGAEFTDIKKGDIIFNHKQTEQLLSKGYVTGRGKAYAEGTAYAGINTFGSKNLSGTEIAKASEKLEKAAKKTSKASEDFEEVFDWIAVRIEEITEKIDLASAKLENAIGSTNQNSIIDQLIISNKELYDNLIAGAAKYAEYASKLLQEVPAEYRQAVQDGSIAIEKFENEDTHEAIEKYREWVQKGAEATQQAEETLTEIASLAKQAIDNIAQDYENKLSLPEGKIAQLEAYNDLIETTVGAESEKVYKALIKENKNNINILKEQRDAMQNELNKRVEAGEIKKYSDAWYEVINSISEVDTEIIELTTDVNDLQDSINELHWDHFDNLIGRLEAITNEAENLIDVLSAKDLVDKEAAEWTDEGIASMALYVQQMENAEIQAAKYGEEIKYLNKNWQKLGYTEQEYVEKLEDLKNGQYDAIKAYNDTKDAIVDLTKERVDAIKEGIEKEIEAYEELISKKKEELDSEKDLYDFQKGVADQQKNIADLERKLAALSADNSASARAQRAKLQAELAEAQQELQDTYYDRSVQDQQEALDKELENFQEEKDKEIESWEEYLEDTETVVSDSLALIQSNTDIVYQTLKEMGEEYSLNIADAITSPWKDGEDAIQSYSETFGLTLSSTVEELRKIAADYKEVMAEIEGAGSEAVAQVNTNAQTYKNNTTTAATTQNSTGDNSSTTQGMISSLSGNIQYGDTGSNVKKLQRALNELGYGNSGTSSVDGVFGAGTQSAVQAFQRAMGVSADGIVGPDTKKKFKAKGYSKGTTGVNKDQLALIDELGEELVIRPSNGRMAFLEKGSGVVPADLTANLMEWGELDPSVMLDQNRPQITMSPEVHNTEFNITMDIAEVVHIDKVDKENLPDLTKAIEKQLDKYMKNLNAQIRRYTR